jgi:predicted AAA+ superfamily ATPase
LLRQSSESLAGRIAFCELPGLPLTEVPDSDVSKLWLRGGFPRAFLARLSRTRRFWTMLAHHHAQHWNSSELARAFGVADITVRGYLDRLCDALVIRQLAPWHENLAKPDLAGHPKIDASDVGLAVLSISRYADRYAKQGGEWHIERHEITLEFGNAALGRQLGFSGG